MYLNLSIFMFLTSCLMYSYFYKHLLLTLISLEFMMITSLYTIYMCIMPFKLNLFFISIFLTTSICESVLGLSLLILFVRYSGNDYLNKFTIMKW